MPMSFSPQQIADFLRQNPQLSDIASKYGGISGAGSALGLGLSAGQGGPGSPMDLLGSGGQVSPPPPAGDMPGGASVDEGGLMVPSMPNMPATPSQVMPPPGMQMNDQAPPITPPGGQGLMPPPKPGGDQYDQSRYRTTPVNPALADIPGGALEPGGSSTRDMTRMLEGMSRLGQGSAVYDQAGQQPQPEATGPRDRMQMMQPGLDPRRKRPQQPY
jgi:hypothetical protein